jgi:hypothetical protein
MLEDGEMKLMKDLIIGDKVQSIVHKDGEWKVIYTPVFFFGHKNDKEGAYISLFYNNSAFEVSQSISLSDDHLLFVVDCKEDRSIFPKSISARDIEIGQCVWKVSNKEIEPVKIIRKERNVYNGQYSPFTEEGTLIVNGIYSSSYAYYHYIGKVIFAPLNMLYYVNPGWMGSDILYGVFSMGYHFLFAIERFILTPWITSWIENFLYYLDYSSYMREVNKMVEIISPNVWTIK